jgi:hypothetical protein
MNSRLMLFLFSLQIKNKIHFLFSFVVAGTATSYR